jgi:hypothetical protein
MAKGHIENMICEGESKRVTTEQARQRRMTLRLQQAQGVIIDPVEGKRAAAQFSQNCPGPAADLQDAPGTIQAAALEEIFAQRASPGSLLKKTGMPVDHQ